MRLPRLAAILMACRYKPGYRLFYEPTICPGTVRVVVETALLPNSRTGQDRTEARIRVQHAVTVDLAHCTTQRVLAAVEAMLIGLESHEAQEWFRYRGQLVTDPHSLQGRVASTLTEMRRRVEQEAAATKKKRPPKRPRPLPPAA